jgi:hypothetical protein
VHLVEQRHQDTDRPFRVIHERIYVAAQFGNALGVRRATLRDSGVIYWHNYLVLVPGAATLMAGVVGFDHRMVARVGRVVSQTHWSVL